MLFDFNGAIVDDTTDTSGEILNHPSNVVVFVNRGGHANQTVTPFPLPYSEGMAPIRLSHQSRLIGQLSHFPRPPVGSKTPLQR
jgi:hypothetical protein